MKLKSLYGATFNFIHSLIAILSYHITRKQADRSNSELLTIDTEAQP